MTQELTNYFKEDPFAKATGMELIEWADGYAKVALKLTENMLNFHGAANGGMVFGLTDYAFAIASNSYGRVAVGINTHMSFLSAAKAGDQYTA